MEGIHMVMGGVYMYCVKNKCGENALGYLHSSNQISGISYRI